MTIGDPRYTCHPDGLPADREQAPTAANVRNVCWSWHPDLSKPLGRRLPSSRKEPGKARASEGEPGSPKKSPRHGFRINFTLLMFVAQNVLWSVMLTSDLYYSLHCRGSRKCKIKEAFGCFAAHLEPPADVKSSWTRRDMAQMFPCRERERAAALMPRSKKEKERERK